MSRDERIVPLIEAESGSSRRVRSALGAARDDLPSADRVEAMLARLPIGGPGGGPEGPGGADGAPGGEPGIGTEGAGGIGAAAGGGALAKIGAVAAITITAGVAYVGLRAKEPTQTTPVVIQWAAPAPPQPAISVTRPAPTPEPPSASPAAAPVKAAPSGSVQAPKATRTEIEILREAQAARGSNPSRALALVAEHARSHPNGRLTQEREMIRIEATLALGRRAEASALARQFRARYPGSAYAQRLDDVLPP